MKFPVCGFTLTSRSEGAFTLIRLLLSANKADRRSCKGFTLIELIVTISILGILAASGIALYTNVQKKSRDNIRISDLNNLKLILHLYKRDQGTFIPWTSTTDGTSNWSLWQAHASDITLGATGSATNSLKTVLTPKYIEKIPTDPKFNTSSDDYYLKITPSSFILSAKLEVSPSAVLNCIPEGAQRNYCITE